MRTQKKRILQSFVVFILCLVSAGISAMPRSSPIPYDIYPVCWQGFYLNGQLGMGENREHARFTNSNYFNTLGPVLLGSHYKDKAQGFVGGGALGYNYQNERLVLGVEAGGVSTNFKKSRNSPFFPATDIFSSHFQGIAFVKGRAGFAYEDWLLFATGGWAEGRQILKLRDTSSGIEAKLKTWAQGWTFGAGFDCKLAECLSMGMGYDYYRLQYPNKTANCSSCGSGIGLGSPKISTDFNIQTLTIRLSYFFPTQSFHTLH